MVCDCIKNIFKRIKGNRTKVNRANEVRIDHPIIDLKKPLIEPIENDVDNFNNIPFWASDASQFWTCSMGNIHSNSQEYCQCLHISAINKFKQR